VHELLKAGILDDVIERGFKPHGVCWRRINGELLTTLDQTVVIEDPMAMVCLPLGLLGALMVEHAAKYPNMTIHWGHEVTSISQDDKSARVVASTKDGEKTFEGTYVVGCDGANSKVRRELLGEWNFPGHTWDEWVVATNVLTALYAPKDRSIIHLKSLAISTRISSYIQKIGTWQQRSRKMDCGVFPTANCPV
jgi:2-polyprenyl-6-methoxyphenol hydroxylase-like FAD-dependent oxidoreductase